MCTGNGQHTNRAAADGAAANGAAGDGPGDMNGEVPSVKRLQLQFSDAVWIRPMCLLELGGVLREHHSSRVRMVFGNTAAGKLPHPSPPIKMGSDDNHFNVSVIVRGKITERCPQITIVKEKRKPKLGIKLMYAYQPNTLLLWCPQITIVNEKGEPKQRIELTYSYQPNTLPLDQSGSHTPVMKYFHKGCHATFSEGMSQCMSYFQ